MINQNKSKFFTLLELIISMSALVVVLSILIQFLGTSQKVWEFADNKQTSSINARIAFDMISKDLQGIFYSDGSNHAPFWHAKGTPGFTRTYPLAGNELLAFVTNSAIPPNDECNQNKDVKNLDLYEVKYQNYYYDGSNNLEKKKLNGWLRRSVIGDKNEKSKSNASSSNMSTNNKDNKDPKDPKATGKWNDFNDETLISVMNVSYDDENSVFTVNSNSSGEYQKLIPYVTKLEFECFDKENNIIPIHKIRSTAITELDALTYRNPSNNKITDKLFPITPKNAQPPYYYVPPYSITITLTLMDRKSWYKWISLVKKSKDLNPAVEDDDNYKLSIQTAAYKFRIKNQKTFSTTVFIGNRGNY